MLIKETYYFNVFLDTDGVPEINSKALSYDDMLDEINDFPQYAYTLVFEYGEQPKQIDFDEIANMRLEESMMTDEQRLMTVHIDQLSGRV